MGLKRSIDMGKIYPIRLTSLPRGRARRAGRPADSDLLRNLRSFEAIEIETDTGLAVVTGNRGFVASAKG
jgi:hypothetical protein